MKKWLGLVALCMAFGAQAQTPNTTLTGVLLSPSGTPISGNLFLQLSGTANVTVPCGGPAIVASEPPFIFSLTAGSISGPGTAPYLVWGANCLSPSGLTYHMTATDSGGQTVVERDVSISGSSVDIGSLSPVAPSPAVVSQLAGDVTGAATQTRVVGLQGDPLVTTGRTNGQVLGFNGSAWGATSTPTLPGFLKADGTTPLTAGWSAGQVITATGFAGPLTGNVTGNLTGNVTGDASLDVKADGTRALTAGWNAGLFRIDSQNSTRDFNIIAYGADPTGAASSVAAITAAIAAMPSSGGVLRGPSGTYLIDSTITLSKSVTIIGDGDFIAAGPTFGTRFKKAASLNGPVFNVQANAVSFRDFYVDGNKAGGALGDGITIATGGGTAQLFTASRVTVDSNAGNGITIGGGSASISDWFRFDHVASNNNGADGIVLDSTNPDANGGTFTGCLFNSNTGDGIHFLRAQYNTIVGGGAELNANGYHFGTGSYQNAVFGGDPEQNTSNQVLIDAAAQYTLISGLPLAKVVNNSLSTNGTALYLPDAIRFAGTRSGLNSGPGLAIFRDTTAFAANVGGGLSFEGAFNGTPGFTTFGAIGAHKLNGTTGNYDAAVAIYVRANGRGAWNMMGAGGPTSDGPVAVFLPSGAMVINGVSASNSPITWYNPGGTAALAVPGVLFTQTADATVTNTVAETSLIGTGSGTMTLPANLLVAGRTLRLQVRGTATETLGASFTLKVKYGTTVLATTAGFIPGTTTNAYLIDVLITCRSVGGSGTVVLEGFEEANNTGAWFEAPVSSGGAITIDTTAAKLLDATVTWSAGNASNTVLSRIATLEVLN